MRVPVVWTFNWPLWSLDDCWQTNDELHSIYWLWPFWKRGSSLSLSLIQSHWSFLTSHMDSFKGCKTHRHTAVVYDVNSIFSVTILFFIKLVFFCFLEAWVDKTPQKVFLHCQSEYISILAPVSLVSLLRLLVLSFTFTFCGSMSYFFFILPSSFSFPLSPWGF